MNIIYAIIIFLIGLAVGSFLNVLIFRIDDLKSVLKTRSKCLHCQQEIKWYDLLPLLSFVLLRGRCRNCGKEISWQYPLVEFAVAVFFLIFYLQFQLTWTMAYFCLIFAILTVIFVYDLKTQTIPDEFVWLVLLLVVAGAWYFSGIGVLDMLLGGLIGGGVITFLVLVSKEKWMGAGDIKVGFALGALVGYPQALLLLFLAFVLGSLFGLGLIMVKRKSLKDSLPFTPFLISSAFITLFFGNIIVFWYLNRIGL